MSRNNSNFWLGEKVGAIFGSFLKLILALATIASAFWSAWKLEPDKEVADKAPLLLGIGLSTFSLLGLFLYVKYWEEKPEFSAACGRQALLGLGCYLGFLLIAHYFPAADNRW